ncbi:peptidylprolyl isomerase [Geodermatophilus sp. YIM 151500]|uniref:peptidylprolyl isomerase n=1 Tax=Geodermatophilus sp. YIM 151500 TaxID=2984531 RepID=UPI0021E42578|nr:peptidylprolyl isomerase [Geodermatophilus sp. YIM 151500]MCV2491442.1 peptidylprolyl isomerase [Geodermatophilus sp. YIM 151500]
MPTNKQRREAAQRHLQRQLERRADAARRRRRNTGIVAAVVAALVVTGVVLLGTGVIGGGDPASDAAADATATPGAAQTAAAAPTSAPPAPSTNPDGTVTCTYAPTPTDAPDVTDVGTPPNPGATPAQGTTTLRMTTDQGELTLTLDRSLAPCAAASFTHLAEQDFFTGSPCHRLVTQPTFGVLQCGDPSGTGGGGPAYRFAEEVTPETTYPRGTIAMAKSADPGTTGSQFFLVFTDAQLAPDYTVVGTVDEAGLQVLDRIAAAGDDGSFEPSPGGGAPNLPVTVQDVAVVG